MRNDRLIVVKKRLDQVSKNLLEINAIMLSIILC